MQTSLRPSSQDDLPWLDLFYESQMRPFVERTHTWNSGVFSENFDAEETSIITYCSEDVGMLKVKRHEDHIYLADILIKPEFQGRGFGTALISELISESKLKNIPLKLRVLKVNPALELYTKLGFSIESENDHAVFLIALS